MQERKVQSWVGKIPWRREWLPTPYSCLKHPMDREPGGLKYMGSQESDMTEHTCIQCTVKGQHLGKRNRATYLRMSSKDWRHDCG